MMVYGTLAGEIPDVGFHYRMHDKERQDDVYHVTQDMAQDFNSSEPETSSILSTSSHDTLLTVELSSGLLWANESQLTGVRKTGNLSSCICCSGRNMKEAVRL